MEWIKCSDRLPEIDCLVLGYKNIKVGDYKENEIYMVYLTKMPGGDYFVIEDNSHEVMNNHREVGEFSHWMPLPNTPE